MAPKEESQSGEEMTPQTLEMVQLLLLDTMQLVNDTESEDPIHQMRLNMLNAYFKNPPVVNKILINKNGIGLAAIHLAASLQNITLLNFFKNNNNIDVNVKFVKDGKEIGNVLDFVTLSETAIKLEVFKFVLDLKNIKISELDEDHANIPLVLEEAVKRNREDLVFLLLSLEKTFPKFNHSLAALSCIGNNKIKLFTKLLPKITEDWIPPGVKRCPICKVSCDVSLLHISICSRQPKFLGLLLQSGWEASSVRPSTGLTPLQDAVGRIQHRTGPVAGGCSSGVCCEVLRELVAAPDLDLTVCVEEAGRFRLAMEVALEGNMCDPARKFLQHQLKKINMRKKLEDRKMKIKGDAEGSLSSEETCWNCSASSDIKKLSQCANCRAAWYCGEVCQREDWEKHWQWCQERQELRRRNKEQKRRDGEENKHQPFTTNSLAYALD